MNIIEKLRQRRAKTTAQLNADYAQLVAKLATGANVSESQVETCLAAVDKDVDDLETDAQAYRKRADLRAKADTLQDHRAEVNRLAEESIALGERYQAAISAFALEEQTLQAQADATQALADAALTAERELTKCCPKWLKAEVEKISNAMHENAKQIDFCRKNGQQFREGIEQRKAAGVSYDMQQGEYDTLLGTLDAATQRDRELQSRLQLCETLMGEVWPRPEDLEG